MKINPPISSKSSYAWIGETITNTSYDPLYKVQPGELGFDPLRYYKLLPKNLDISSKLYKDAFISEVNPSLSAHTWEQAPKASVDSVKIDLVMKQWGNVIDFNKVNLTYSFVYVDNIGSNSGVTYIGAGAYKDERVIFFNYNLAAQSGGFDMKNLSLGTWAGAIALHEIGHGLGLNHSYEPAPQVRDFRFTVMDYAARVGVDIDPSVKIPLTPGMKDIADLQAPSKFGESHAQDGNTTYKFSQTTADLGHGNLLAGVTGADLKNYVMTIFDRAGSAGGNDTIDASAFNNTQNLYIDLRAGHFSAIGTLGTSAAIAPTGADLNGDGDPDGDTNYNVGIAVGAQIENAKGGSGDDILTGNDQANILEGNAGKDKLIGGKGADTLKGGDNDDTLDGGKDGAIDILEGGTGFDTYLIHAGEHETITDSDGKGQIRYIASDGKTINIILGAFVQVGTTNEWKHTLADGSIVSFTHNSPWKLTMPDGSIIELGETFNDGDFGINLVQNTPTNTPTSRNIFGDLKPIDFDPATAGVQTQNDDIGNVIVSTTAEANRADTLLDSAGNDHIMGLGGNDMIRSFRGGNDFVQGGTGDDIISAYSQTGIVGGGDKRIEGNAGADILVSGTGSDTIYGGDTIALDLAITQGATATANNIKGDWLDGGAGDDTIIGTNTNDMLLGGAGDDTFYGDALHKKSHLKIPLCHTENSPKENHAYASRVDIGSQRRPKDIWLKSSANQAKIHTCADNNNHWRLAA